MSFKISNKIKATVLIGAFLPIFFTNCFGNFPLLKKAYAFNKSLGGKDFGGRFIREVVMIAMWIIPIYEIFFLVDFAILNLVEFWTGNNPVAINQFDKNGTYEKKVTYKDKTIHMKFTEFGKKLTLEFENDNHEKESFLAFKNQPGKLFTETDGTLNEIKMNTITTGSKTVVTITEGNKLKSSKVIDESDMKLLQEKFHFAL